MNLTKKDEDFSHAGIVNKECERFKLNELTLDMFKEIIFVQCLTEKKDAEICARIATKLEQNQKLILQEISAECPRTLNLRRDTDENEEKECTYTQAKRKLIHV